MTESNRIAITADGVAIPYRLDGCSDSTRPLIVLSNPSMVDYSIWDDVVNRFLAVSKNRNYRLLRYNTRGRSDKGGNKPWTIDDLTNDVICLLDILKVRKAAAVIGISLGGMTALNLALKNPDRIATVIPCDFFPESPPNNREIWMSRVSISQEDRTAPRDKDGARVVGQHLAEVTVRRWLSPKSLEGGLEECRVLALQRMVGENSLEGLISIVHAISSYDLRQGIETASVPATFIAGADDQPVLPGMTELAESYGKGAELHIIPRAGHLPVVEQPGELVLIMTKFLEAHSSAIKVA